MRTLGAVLLTFVLVAAMWTLLYNGAWWISTLAERAGYAGAVPGPLLIVVFWFLVPALAGYAAVGATHAILRRASAPAAFTAFVASYATFAVLFLVVQLLLWRAGRSESVSALGGTGQLACVLLGAWWARPTPAAAAGGAIHETGER